MSSEDQLKAVFKDARCVQAMVTTNEGYEGLNYWIEGVPVRTRMTYASPERAWDQTLKKYRLLRGGALDQRKRLAMTEEITRHRLQIRPLTQKQAKGLVCEWHRHHKAPRGDRFHIGAAVDGVFIGAIMVGRPVARLTDQYQIADAIRCVTNGYRNGCSKLYGSAARIAKEMGYDEIQTFILESESGVSLKAAGWTLDVLADGTPKKFGGGSWNRPSRGGRREDQPQEFKHRWFRKFRETKSDD